MASEATETPTTPAPVATENTPAEEAKPEAATSLYDALFGGKTGDQPSVESFEASETAKTEAPAAPTEEAKTEDQPGAEEPKAEEPEAQFEYAVAQLRKVRARERKAAQKEKELASKEAEVQEALKLRERLKQDPYAVVREYGGTLHEWATKVNQGEAEPAPPPVNPQLEELKQLVQRQAEELEALKQAPQKLEQEKTAAQAVEEYKTGLYNNIRQSEDFKVLDAVGLAPQVYDLVVRYAKETLERTGEAQLPDWRKAAAFVLRQNQEEIERRKALLGGSSQASTAPAETPVQTLTPSNAGGPAASSNEKPLTPEERRARFMKQLFGEEPIP